MKKGLELPINMIVIIALAVLILVIVTAFTTSQVGAGVGSIGLEAAFASSCTTYRNNGCTGSLSSVAYAKDVQGLKKGMTLAEMCTQKGIEAAKCSETCGCLPLAQGVAPGAGSQFGQAGCPPGMTPVNGVCV